MWYKFGRFLRDWSKFTIIWSKSITIWSKLLLFDRDFTMILITLTPHEVMHHMQHDKLLTNVCEKEKPAILFLWMTGNLC